MVESEDTRFRELKRPTAAPAALAGTWVAWNRERTTIVAQGKDFGDAYRKAKAAGHSDAVLQKVPQARSFVGAW